MRTSSTDVLRLQKWAVATPGRFKTFAAKRIAWMANQEIQELTHPVGPRTVHSVLEMEGIEFYRKGVTTKPKPPRKRINHHDARALAKAILILSKEFEVKLDNEIRDRILVLANDTTPTTE